MLRFNLEEMNQLEFLDATEPPNQQGLRNLTVTGPDHPYSENFWKPGHIIGYEHTFIATLGDFLSTLDRQNLRMLISMPRSKSKEFWMRSSDQPHPVAG